MKWFSIFLVILLALPALGKTGLEGLPIQDGGRLKPFDTFARETLQLVYGKQVYKPKRDGTAYTEDEKAQKPRKIPATEAVFTWMLVPEYWQNVKLFKIQHNGLREALDLDKVELYYSMAQLQTNERMMLVFSELAEKRANEEKLNPYYQAVQTLQSQLVLFQAVSKGEGLKVMPAAEGTKWLSVAELQEPYRSQFAELSKAFAGVAQAQQQKGDVKAAQAEVAAVVSRFRNGLAKDFAGQFRGQGVDRAPAYPSLQRIDVEVHYNSSNVFMWAFILYLIGVIFMTSSWVGTNPLYYKLAWAFTWLGLVVHTYGFGLRVYIIERAPVTNMYETVLWVAWGAVVLAMIFEKINRSKIIMIAAGSAATLCLALTHLSAQVLDPTLSPLEPVLRDNFWLLTHVLIITLSYAAFFLAFFIGDILMFYYLKDEKAHAQKIKEGNNAIYRSIQIGVVLLAGGIILGGVWADYSWGRFWGWDPKETWSFIALMGYLAILHGRLAGWLRGFGLSASSIVSFSLVIMSWYGVNFVLGAGLHTYGFGAGGVEYVSAFVAVHLLFVAYVTTVRQSRLKTQ